MPKRTNMKCYNCVYSVLFAHDQFQCRRTPNFVIKNITDFCGEGLWSEWCERFNCNVFYYFHEGETV